MSRSPFVTSSIILGLCMVIGAALISRAGPLDPPAGPIASSYKTLTAVEPRIEINATNTPGDADSVFKITKLGSYYLSDNVLASAGKSGIEIAAGTVTVDLNGFNIRGVNTSLAGVRVTANISGVVLLNGTISGLGADGVSMATASNSRIADVISTFNGGCGFIIGGNSRIERCTAGSNALSGINAQSTGCTISGCTSHNNESTGIYHGGAGVIENCNSFQNAGDGIQNNGADTIVNCSCWDNDDAGFRVINTTLTDCHAQANLDGIVANGRCVISRCEANQNSSDGIETATGALISGCACSQNTASGIHITGNSNRIDGNNLEGNGKGLDVDASGNIIVRNTARNTGANYQVVAGNVGLYINATTAGAVNGSSGGAAPGSTDPSANFSY